VLIVLEFAESSILPNGNFRKFFSLAGEGFAFSNSRWPRQSPPTDIENMTNSAISWKQCGHAGYDVSFCYSWKLHNINGLSIGTKIRDIE